MPDEWFAVYRSTTGDLVSTGTVVATDEELAAAGFEKKPIPDPSTLIRKSWDPTTRDYKDLPPEPPFIINNTQTAISNKALNIDTLAGTLKSVTDEQKRRDLKSIQALSFEIEELAAIALDKL